MLDRRTTVVDTQASLQFLARETGGLAIINNNDLSGGIRKILDDQSYYLIGYEPDLETFDPKTSKFNKLEIKVTRPGVKARYRSGFFGVSDDPMLKLKPVQTNEQRVLDALTSPFAVNQIALKLNALYFNSTRSGSSIRSLLHIKAQDLKFADLPDGSKKAAFDIMAMAFGDNGSIVQQTGKTYELTLKKQAYERVLKTGIVYDFSFPMKKPGAYQLRIALRDQGGDRIGSANQFIDVPNLKKKRLVLSGIAVESVPFDEWKNRSEGKPALAGVSDAVTDTALRQFKRGTVLNYGYTIYNTTAASKVIYQTRVFRDGNVFYESSPKPVDGAFDQSTGGIAFNGALALGSEMLPGDYVLQVVVSDGSSSDKKNIATQFVSFEILE
jgi:hypothetical protein